MDIEDIADSHVDANFSFLSTAITRVEGETSTPTTMAVDLVNPLNFAPALYNRVTSIEGSSTYKYPISVDTTDGAGNGFLVATDRMFLYAAASGNTVAGTTIAKILYRLTEVGIQEYVGIVAGQQG